jgi:hypothetical protein
MSLIGDCGLNKSAIYFRILYILIVSILSLPFLQFFGFFNISVLNWSRSGARTSRTRTEPEPNPRFGVRCGHRVEHEPHMRFEPGCTWVHPFIYNIYIYIYLCPVSLCPFPLNFISVISFLLLCKTFLNND